MSEQAGQVAHLFADGRQVPVGRGDAPVDRSEDAVPTSSGDLAAGVALVDGGDTFDALRLKAAVVDAHALGQHEVALFGCVSANWRPQYGHYFSAV